MWKYRAGRVTSLDELAAELPGFVHRGRPGAEARPSRPHPRPARPPRIRVPRVQVRKPVLYLYSNEPCRPLSVNVRVGMPVGGQSLYYPAATATRSGLSFMGSVYPTQGTGGCSPPPAMARVASSHFWHDLRQVPASVFVAAGSEEAERFIFYDGLTELRSPYVFYGAGGHSSVSARPGRHAQAGFDDVIFAVHAGMYHRVVLPADARAPLPIASGDERPLSMLEAELRSQLMARGLTAPEAQSLLVTWRHDLVEASGDRRIYFVDRADYDRMLPITISPAPRQLVRVGLVIELP
ncbi:MAG: hypothetical protein GXP55_01080 [Deltaproteobacteria bacterium]|nr:hypothetical protein [Deltaproteobacteria bacterium]